MLDRGAENKRQKTTPVDQTAALILHKIFFLTNTVTPEGGVKEKEIRMLKRTGWLLLQKQGLQTSTLISRLIGRKKFQSILIRLSWPALLAEIIALRGPHLLGVHTLAY